MFEQFIWSNITTPIIRLVLALLCGGFLGFERGRKKRPAGFRTYILVCIGATLIMMTNEYICKTYGTGDPARMGAQVISGIGFLCAGTILVTGHNRVVGLTTAAGLWTTACIGLAIGIGYYVGAILGTIMIFIAITVLHTVDNSVMSNTKVLNIYIVFKKLSNINEFVQYMKACNIKINGLEWTKANVVNEGGIAALITLSLPKKQLHEEVVFLLNNANGVEFVEEV